MTLKEKTKDTMKSSSKQGEGLTTSRPPQSQEFKAESEHLKELDKLLDAWPDDDEETSDVHIEEYHYHAPKIPDEQSLGSSPFSKTEEVTKPYDIGPPKVSKRPSFTPKAQRITAVILAVAAGIAGAAKILWDAWSGLKK